MLSYRLSSVNDLQAIKQSDFLCEILHGLTSF